MAASRSHPQTLHRRLRLRRGRSSVGRAPQSHCGGQGVKSPRLHQSFSSGLLACRGTFLFASYSAAGADHVADSAADSELWRGGLRQFWIARVASSVAWQMLVVAVGWQIYELTSDPLALGLLG